MTVVQSISVRSVKPLLLLLISLAVLSVGAAVAAEHSTETSADMQNRFDTAMEALDAERVYTARRILRELLADYPTLHRARLELARANYLAYDFDAAAAEIQQVLADPEVPPAVRTTLLAFQAQIRDDKQSFARRHDWSGQVYGGLLYDSNANFGINDVVVVLGIPFTNEELSDGAAVADAGLLHTYNPNRSFRAGEKTGFFIWQTQGNAYYRAYFDETDFNLGVLTLRTGPAWVVADAWRASIALQGDQIWLGGDNLAFFTSLNPQLTWQHDADTEFTIGMTATDRNYKRTMDNGRDGDHYRAYATVSQLYMDEKFGVQAGIAYADFDADDDTFGYKGPEVFAGVAYQAWERGSVYARLGYRKFDYDAPLPPFTASRDDDEWRGTLGFRHELQETLSGWVVRGEWIYTDNNSNDPRFDYDRHLVSLGLQKSF